MTEIRHGHTPGAQSQKYDTVTHPVHSHRKTTRSHTRCTVTEIRHGHAPRERSAVCVPQGKATVSEFDQLPRSRLPSLASSGVRQLPTCVRAQRQDEPSGHSGAGTQHLTWYTSTRIPHLTWDSGARIPHLTGDSGASVPHLTCDSGASVPHLTCDRGASVPHLTCDSGASVPHLTCDCGASVPHLTWESYQHTSPDVGQWYQNLI